MAASRRGPAPEYPRARIDGLLSAAARSHPDHSALRAESTELTFAGLDELTSVCAAALRREIGGAGSVVGLASVLGPAFPVVYFGAVRSGNIVAPINPFLRERELGHVLMSSRARLVFVTAEMAERIERVRDGLEHLERIVVLDDGPPEPALRAALGAELGAEVADDTEVDVDAVACLLFTSGTTGLPKTVQLTHGNVTTNAVQVAHAHGLNDRSVMMNYLPTFHPMHLTAGVYARATHVLCASPDAGDSLVVAREAGVTHYYSLPVRLARLVIDRRLAGFDIPTLELIASGGSALSPQSAAELAGHFGVPAIQGYGLAETSPLTNSDIPSEPKSGSVGPPVADTECRVVDVTTREVLASGESGEVQVRGPQVMKGYLGEEPNAALDPDGWLSTGDVGYLDDDGWLFLVDRIKDVFKCDNWLVSPTQIERVVAEHPGIRECVIVGLPDELRGAVPFAFLVLADRDAGRRGAEEILERVNGQLPYYQQIKHFELLAAIPRGPTGKVSRMELRAAASRRSSEVQTP